MAKRGELLRGIILGVKGGRLEAQEGHRLHGRRNSLGD